MENRFGYLYKQSIQGMNSRMVGFGRCMMANVSISCTSSFFGLRLRNSNSSPVQLEAANRNATWVVRGHRQQEG